MPKKYDSLYSLIEDDKAAMDYYNMLPEYARESIAQRAQHINSIDSLKDYAENLTRGDQ